MNIFYKRKTACYIYRKICTDSIVSGSKLDTVNITIISSLFLVDRNENVEPSDRNDTKDGGCLSD